MVCVQAEAGRAEHGPYKLFSKCDVAVNIHHHVYGLKRYDVHLKLPMCYRIIRVVWEQTNYRVQKHNHILLSSKRDFSNTKKRIDNSQPLLIQYGTYWPQLSAHNVKCRSMPWEYQLQVGYLETTGDHGPPKYRTFSLLQKVLQDDSTRDGYSVGSQYSIQCHT